MFDLLFAFATIWLAINIIKVVKRVLEILGSVGGASASAQGQIAADVPLRQQFRPVLLGFLSIILMIAAVRVPPMLIADADSIDSIWLTGWNIVKGVFTGFGESGSSEGSMLYIFSFALIATRSSFDPPWINWKRSAKNFWMRVKQLIFRIKVFTLHKIPGG